MNPIEVFNNGRERAEYLINLYELLRNRRLRATRQDWARRFKGFMRWPTPERIHRVDGEHAILILRHQAALTPQHFATDTLNELLRASLVGIIAALDRYCHELVVSRVLGELRKSPRNANRELRGLQIPVFAVKAAVLHARQRRGRGGRIRPRPMNLVRDAIQAVLYQETFQGPDDITRGLRIAGVENLWRQCGQRMNCRGDDIIRRLNRVVERRNRIVHEGDIELRKKGGGVKLRDLTPNEVRQDVQWVTALVHAIEAVAN